MVDSVGMKIKSEAVSPTRRLRLSDPMFCHLFPFVAWIVIMALPGDPSAIKYALRTFVTGAFLLYLRPWRWYAPMRSTHLLPSLFVGFGVFAIWVAGESTLAKGIPALQDAYLRYGIFPLAQLPLPQTSISPYHPNVCGWPLTLIRILGSGVIIALAEEFFWRGCLYRSLIARDFVNVDLGCYNAIAFWIVCAAFGFEHPRWFVGILAGAAYALLMLKTRNIWPPVLAHGTTNLLLGFYAVLGNHYEFWS